MRRFCEGPLSATRQPLRRRQSHPPERVRFLTCSFGADRALPQTMATARTFEDLAAWRFCREMEDVIFDLTDTGRVTRDREFWKQIRDAASAAPPLIAEGFTRWTPRQFAHYLKMARGEIAEVQSKLHSAKARKYFTADDLSRAMQVTKRAMGTTTNLLKAKLRQLGEDQ